MFNGKEVIVTCSLSGGVSLGEPAGQLSLFRRVDSKYAPYRSSQSTIISSKSRIPSCPPPAARRNRAGRTRLFNLLIEAPSESADAGLVACSFSLPLYEAFGLVEMVAAAVYAVLTSRIGRVSLTGEMGLSSRSFEDDSTTERRVERVLDGPASPVVLVEGDMAHRTHRVKGERGVMDEC